MKNLNQFNAFDMGAFSKDKVFMTTACREWKDFDTGNHLGTVVDVVIIQDDTPYKQKSGETVSNLYEKLSLKVAKDISIPIRTKVVPVNAVGTIYGQYRNELSVKCDDVKIATVSTSQVSSTPKPELQKTQ